MTLECSKMYCNEAGYFSPRQCDSPATCGVIFHVQYYDAVNAYFIISHALKFHAVAHAQILRHEERTRMIIHRKNKHRTPRLPACLHSVCQCCNPLTPLLI